LNVIVFGGTGFVGRHLTRELLERGCQVHIITRNRNTAAERVGDAVNLIEWDYNSPLAILNLPEVEAVINLAGESIGSRRWTAAVKEEIERSRVKTTHAIVTAINNGTLVTPLLINASAVGYYGPCGDEVVTEETKPGEDFLAKVCRAWEGEAYKVNRSKARVVTLRLGVVLGKDSAALKRMALPFKFYVGGPLGRGNQYLSWIHIQDLTRMILYIMDHPELTGPVNAVAPYPERSRDFSRIIGEVLRKPSWLPVPEPLLRVALGQMAEMLLHGQRAVPRKMLDAGFEFEFPTLKAALAEIWQEN